MLVNGLDSQSVKESKWISQAFFKRRSGGAGNQNEAFSGRRNLNFYDTTLGGCKSINPPPQFTRHADPKRRSVSPSSKGMGRYYEKAIFNNRQRVSLQAGVPVFNPVSRFFSNFYDAAMGSYVKSGETSLAFNAGYTIGTLFTLPLQAYFGMNRMYDKIKSTLTGNPYSKFYYMSPRMAQFWTSASLIFNKLAVETGAIAGMTPADIQVNPNGVEFNGDNAGNVGAIAEMLPDVLRESVSGGHYIDVKSLSSRSQRMADVFNRTIEEVAANAESMDDFKTRMRALQEPGSDLEGRLSSVPKPSDMESYLDAYVTSGIGGTKTGPAPNIDANGEPVVSKTDAVAESGMPGQDETGVFEFLAAELKEGSAFITFDVNYTGPTSASFSNSTKAPGIKETINSTSSAARDMYVNFGGGNLGDGFLANAVESATSAVKDLLIGGASSVGLGGLGALAGNAYAEIPDVYDDSSADLPQNTYTMRLATPYGNDYSILTRVFYPLACIMAMALPRKTGKGSYGAPFLVREHSQGFADTKLGIIDSLSLEIGTGNTGRNANGLPTVIDVTFSVKNLDSIMPVPVSDSLTSEVMSFSPFDEDNALSDFLTCLAGTSLSDQFYLANRVRRGWALQQANWDQFTSPAFFAQWAASTGPGSLVSSFKRVGDL